MEIVLGVVLAGLVVGALARLAVPGPDPMPWWLTIGFGILGAIVGGGAGSAVAGTVGALTGSVLVATLAIILYRRVVQKRGISGPGAKLRPSRGIGIDAPAPRAAGQSAARDDVLEQLRELGELRDAGVVTPEEFDRKKAELLARI